MNVNKRLKPKSKIKSTNTTAPFLLENKIDDMGAYAYKTINKFSRKYGDLKNRIANVIFDMYELVTYIKYAPTNENKYMLVVQLDQKLAFLRKLIRFGNSKDNFDTPNLPIGAHTYEVWSSINTEIGKMINGLIENIKTKINEKKVVLGGAGTVLQKNPYINPNLRNPNPSFSIKEVQQVQKILESNLEEDEIEE